MNFTKTILIALISFNLNAQIDGDNIFAEDQIIIVDLVFLIHHNFDHSHIH